MDFFLWGYGKDIVYRTKVGYDSDLHQRIIEALDTVTVDMLARTWLEIEYRLDILRATDLFFLFSCIFILLSRESDQCAIRARLGVAGHLSTTPRWGNPAKCLSQRHNK